MELFTKKIQLAADSDAPAWGFTKQYTLPADCLRVLTILDYDADYKIEGRKILTDNSSMKIFIFQELEDPNEYDELLRETLSAALAADIAYAVTSSNPTATNMFNLFQSKLKEARFVDSTEGQNLSPDKGMADVIGADTFIKFEVLIMARVAVQLTNFTGGELSPRLDGRNDLGKYPHGCKTLENFVVFPHGSAARRSGTQFVAEVKDSSAKTRLIPFEFSTTQTYMLEFGNQYIRFYKDDGQILESDKTISGATQANPAVITATGHSYDNGDEISISGVSGMTELNNKRYLVANKTTNTFEITDVDGTNINGTGFTAYTSGGVANKVFEISTPYLTAELFDLKFAQSADVMYITHPNHEVEKLSRTGHTSWTLQMLILLMDHT